MIKGHCCQPLTLVHIFIINIGVNLNTEKKTAFHTSTHIDLIVQGGGGSYSGPASNVVPRGMLNCSTPLNLSEKFLCGNGTLTHVPSDFQLVALCIFGLDTQNLNKITI